MPRPDKVRGKPNTRGTELPKRADGSVDKDAVKQIFLASGHVEWKPFCDAMGWDVVGAYQHFNVKEWTDEKKRIIAERQAEEISNQLFGFKSGWHKEVLKTLKVYPAANDAMLAIIQTRQQQYIGMIERDRHKMKIHQEIQSKQPEVEHPLPPLEFAGVKTGELFQLSLALKTVTSAKYGSLMLDRWSVREAEDFSTTQGNLEQSDASTAREDREWTLELTGGEQITKREMEGFMQRFLDPPQQKVIEAPTSPPAEQVKGDAQD